MLLQYTTHIEHVNLLYEWMKPKKSLKTYSAFTFDFYYKGLGCKDPWKYTIQIQTGCPGGQRSELCTRWDTCARSGHRLGQTGPHSYRANLQEQHTEQGLAEHSSSMTQDTQGVTEHLCLPAKGPQPFPPTCHLAMLEHTLTYKEQEGKSVLPLCSFYSAFSIFPLNTSSLIPSVPCLYLF